MKNRRRFILCVSAVIAFPKKAASALIGSLNLTRESYQEKMVLPEAYKDLGTDWGDGFRADLIAASRPFFRRFRGNIVNTIDVDGDKSDPRLRSVYRQFTVAFGGAPDNAVRLPDGNILYASSRPRDANTKAIVVTLGNTPEIIAIAIVHRRQLYNRSEQRFFSIDSVPTLNIFYSGKTAPNSTVNREICTWLTAHFVRRNSPTGLIEKVRVKAYRTVVRHIHVHPGAKKTVAFNNSQLA